MKDLEIGKFDIGCEQVVLKVREGLGGDFGTKPVATIYVGIQTHDWSFVVQSLLHEVIEYAAFRMNARFNPDGGYSQDHSAFMFVFDHCKFSEICARAAEFIVPALIPLEQAWKAYNHKKK